ncbi:MAG: cytochrome [Magnetococcales bacterium]|nr:cytochrome [Magnetococcales bacterium]
MRKRVVGIMGPGDGASEQEIAWGEALGRRVAKLGCVLLTGGRNVGVMESANRGAQEVGGLTLGILPDADDRRLSQHVDIAVFTDMGNARNNINVLSCDVVIACGMGLGTASEIVLATKAGKPVHLVTDSDSARTFFETFSSKHLTIHTTLESVISALEKAVNS